MSVLLLDKSDELIKRIEEVNISSNNDASAVYARVSMNPNGELGNQVKYLIDCARKLGDKNCFVYAEVASGLATSRRKRSELYRFIFDMKKKNIKRVYVVNRDRFYKDISVMISFFRNIYGTDIEIIETGTAKRTV